VFKQKRERMKKGMCYVKLFHHLRILLIYFEKGIKLFVFFVATYLGGRSHVDQDLELEIIEIILLELILSIRYMQYPILLLF
jgi:hypothetical protein